MLLIDVFFPSLGRNWTKQQQPGKLMLLKGVIPCVNSLRSISGVFKLIHLSVSFSSNYTSVKCHLSRLSLTRVMSSSQPLRQPKWSLHCFEPAGSRCGMEEWAGSPQCDWEAKLTVSFREEVEGGRWTGSVQTSFLASPHISQSKNGIQGVSCLLHRALRLIRAGLNLCPGQQLLYACMTCLQTVKMVVHKRKCGRMLNMIVGLEFPGSLIWSPVCLKLNCVGFFAEMNHKAHKLRKARNFPVIRWCFLRKTQLHWFLLLSNEFSEPTTLDILQNAIYLFNNKPIKKQVLIVGSAST